MEERLDEVVLLDENGEAARFSHVLTFLHEGERYVALEPIEEGGQTQDDDAEAEVVLMRIERGEEGDTYRPVENEVTTFPIGKTTLFFLSILLTAYLITLLL